MFKVTTVHNSYPFKKKQHECLIPVMFSNSVLITWFNNSGEVFELNDNMNKHDITDQNKAK